MHSALGDSTYMKLLLQHEAAVAQFYGLLGGKFPRRQKFWQELAAAEEVHMTWLREMAESLAAGRLHLGEGRVSLQDIRESLNFVATIIAHAETDPSMSEHDGFQTACRVENTMIEKGFFLAMEGDSPEIQERLAWILAQTEEHRDLLSRSCQRPGRWSWLTQWFK